MKTMANANRVFENLATVIDTVHIPFSPTEQIKTLLLIRVGAFQHLRHYYIDLIFFLYNIGDALLDAVFRPNVQLFACFSMDLQPNIGNLSLCRNIDTRLNLETEIQERSSMFFIYHKCITSIPAVIVGMLFGAWSDKHGRRLPLALPSIGASMAIVVFILANTFSKCSLIFLLGSFLQGVTGKTALIYMAVQSYIADVTECGQRTRRLGFVVATQLVGMCIGSLSAGILLDISNDITTYGAALGFHLLVVLLVIFTVNETVESDAESRTFQLKSICRLSHLKASISVLVKKRENNFRRSINILLLILFLHQACRSGRMDVVLLFTTLPPLSWPKSSFGYLSAVDNAVMGVALLFVLPVASHVFKLSDITICMSALTCASIRFIILAWSRYSWMVWFATCLGSIDGLTNVPFRSLLSKLVNENEVAKTFAILGSGETIAKFCSLIFTGLYRVTVSFFPGTTFLVLTAFYGVMFMLTLFVHLSIKKYINGLQQGGEHR